MIRESLVGKIFGIEFIPDAEIKDDDPMLVLDARVTTRGQECRFGEPVPPPVMTAACIATMRGADYKKQVTKVDGSHISIRLVELQHQCCNPK